jgi:PucR C-terminal helix-turn-helix domain/GGDEF-like domain
MRSIFGLMEPDDSTVAALLTAVSAALRMKLPELCQAVTDSILEQIEPLSQDQAIIDLLTVSVESNVTTMVHIIGYQIDSHQADAPPAAIAYARRLAQRGVPVGELLRAYRVGQACFMQWCYSELAVQARDLPTAFAAAMRLTESTFGYIDRVCEHVLTAYLRERDQWVRNTVAVRSAQVRSLLAGGPIEVNRVEPALGYRLRQQHLGIVAWVEEAACTEGTLVELERMAGRLADHLSKGARALFVSRDESSAFIWMPLGSEHVLSSDVFGGTPLAPDAAVRLAVGEPAEGPEGFRITIREALRAHAVALMAGPVAPRVIRFAEVAPVALLTEDIGTARNWVRRALGPLAADDDQTARLRETLHVFLSTGGSYQETAERLSLHKNTVFYRVRKAQEVRGSKVAEDRFAVELALLACHWLGSAVLTAPR